MLRTPLLSMLAVLALAGGVLACGEDEPPASDPAVEQQTTDGATEDPTPTAAAEDSTAEAPQDVEAAVEACKQSAQGQPNLSDDAKSDIEDLCEEAASGDPEDTKAATRKVCERIIEEQVPEGAARDQALETCRTATE